MALVLAAPAIVVARLLTRAAFPRDDGWEIAGGILLVAAFAGLTIGACVLIWRTVRALLRRIDRALPDRERDRRSELEAVYMKARLERWVHTGTSGDAALDTRFAAMRGGQAPRSPAPPSSGDDPRTLALIDALERENRPQRGETRP